MVIKNASILKIKKKTRKILTEKYIKYMLLRACLYIQYESKNTGCFMKFATKKYFYAHGEKLLKLFVTTIIKQIILFNCKFLYFVDRGIVKKRKIV